ncbi:hypothetical protein LDENG_00222740 [Lucifuga dentata]|nr:hypothetical protein LDENG_00222740 [Lucifuga dentata]
MSHSQSFQNETLLTQLHLNTSLLILESGTLDSGLLQKNKSPKSKCFSEQKRKRRRVTHLKMNVCGDEEEDRSQSAASSCPSMKTDKSKSRRSDWSPEPGASHTKVHQQRADSPVPSCVSMKSDRSMDFPLHLSDGRKSAAERVHQQRADSPVPSCVSMKSDRSMDFPLHLSDGQKSAAERSEFKLHHFHWFRLSVLHV